MHLKCSRSSSDKRKLLNRQYSSNLILRHHSNIHKNIFENKNEGKILNKFQTKF